MVRLEIRIPDNEKQEAEAKAEKLGITLTQFTRDSIAGNTIRDYNFEKKYLVAIIKLTTEINCIGRNINQVQKKINQINLGYILPENEVEELNDLIKQYMKTREILSHQIESISLCLI